MYYTYIHTRKDTNKIFYVGKGKGNRAYVAKRNKHWNAIVDKHGFNVCILAHWTTEQQALDHEKFLIQCFLDLGYVLANKTLGGEGTSGLTPWNKGITGQPGHWTGKKRPGIGGRKAGGVPWNKGKTGYSTSRKGTKRSQLSVYKQILNAHGMWHARGYLIKCGVEHPDALGKI